MTDALSAAIESILRADDLSEEIHQAQINNLRDAYEATLAQPVQEPVAHKHEWFRTGAMALGEMRCIQCGAWNHEAAPPQRPAEPVHGIGGEG